MSKPVMAHLIVEQADATGPLYSLTNAIAYSSDDWGRSRAMAWVYGIVLGWDDENEETRTGAMDELAKRFNWTPEAVARLRRLHTEFKQLPGGDHE